MTTSEDIINQRAYEKYKSFALPTKIEMVPYLLKNGWIVKTDVIIGGPDKYRHYFFEEFMEKSKNDDDFKIFYKLLYEKSKEEYFQEIVERLPKEL